MYRRQVLTGGAALLALPSIVRAQSATTLKFVPYADLALLDPLVSAFVTRNHVMMVFDTLFALDEAGVPQPQMLQGYTVEADGKLWRLTLRPGQLFHDGTPVLARDVVASLQRWATKDAFGQALLAATDELSAPSDSVVQFRLKRPFPLLPNALAKPTNLMAAIMPERLARTPAATMLTEMVGSGPFRYIASERVPGARNVYQRFDKYVPRPDGTPSFAAGPRVAHFDRVEWVTMPDPGTQAAALQAGEVDWVEQPVMDLVPQLKKSPGIKVQVIESSGLIGVLRFNFLYPPFDNPAIRQVVLRAVNQRDFMEAVTGDAAPFDAQVGVFAPGMPLANDAGMAELNASHDPAQLKKDLVAAGYKGERVVFLTATDVQRTNAICEVGAQMLRNIGMNVDEVSTDWGTVVQRSVSKQPLDKGGWSMFGSFWGGYDLMNPAGDLLLRGNGANAWNGWPTLPALESLRQSWLEATDPAVQLKLARDIQVQTWKDVPYLPLGQYMQPAAYRANLTDMLVGLPLFTNVRRV
ncbi:MAG: ABC transporter substrate-binding protein [Acetobacteraceae bacterium]